jgi:predicted metal-dependent HD superfamily phosphohydrolase
MDSLPARWLATWAALNLAPPTGLCEQLLRAWDEPQRHYHTLQHLGECLVLFDTLRAHAEQPADIEFALWFHDAVYDVQGHDNEARSAHWAIDALKAGGVDAARCQRVHDLIMATCHTALPASPDQALLVDIDLAILGAPAARFAQYTRQISRIRMGAAAGVRGQTPRRGAGLSRPQADIHDARRRATSGAARQKQPG